MTKHEITGHPEYYFIIRPGIDNPQDASYNRACLYQRTDTGDKWISNLRAENRDIRAIENQFAAKIQLRHQGTYTGKLIMSFND